MHDTFEFGIISTQFTKELDILKQNQYNFEIMILLKNEMFSSTR